jgi:hypothetical protein
MEGEKIQRVRQSQGDEGKETEGERKMGIFEDGGVVGSRSSTHLRSEVRVHWRRGDVDCWPIRKMVTGQVLF